MAAWILRAIVELTPGMTLRTDVRCVVWCGAVLSEIVVSLATELSMMSRVAWVVGVISSARHVARFSPVLLEEGELPMVGGRSAEMAKYGIMG